jgi:hypothetical protein
MHAGGPWRVQEVCLPRRFFELPQSVGAFQVLVPEATAGGAVRQQAAKRDGGRGRYLFLTVIDIVVVAERTKLRRKVLGTPLTFECLAVRMYFHEAIVL